MVKRHGFWIAVIALCALLLTPAAAFAGKHGGHGRWNPTGTYIGVSSGGGALPDGTVFVHQVIPGDNRGHHYMCSQDRINNLDELLSNFRCEMWRTGRNSFDYTLIFYSRVRDAEGLLVIKNAWLVTGVMSRDENGDAWTTDKLMWFSPGCTTYDSMPSPLGVTAGAGLGVGVPA